MPPNDEISTGEIGRNLALIRDDIKGLTAAVEQRPDWNDLKDFRMNLEARIEAERTIRELQRVVADKAIQALEEWNQWAVRIVIGAIITAAIAAVIAVGSGKL